jgi:TetR/AcrR family mexXY operon transcriptional repressor
MARKTKEESQNTRNGILDAAELVFLEKGVAQTAMADIADAAGVSRGAVYGHYKNKIEVCLAMCDRAFARAAEGFELTEDGPALEALREAALHYLQQCVESGSVQRVLEILYMKCEQSEENAPLLRRRTLYDKQTLRITTALLRRAVSNGELPATLNLHLASVYFQSLVEGIFGTMVWTDRLRNTPWEDVDALLLAGIDTLRDSARLRRAKPSAAT